MATSSSERAPGRKSLKGLLSGALSGSGGPGGKGASDHVTLLSGTAQNVVGLAVFALAGIVIQVLVARALGANVFGIVNVGQQLAFITGAATRFGMDMASTRRVAIDVGKGEQGRARPVVRIASAIAAGVSVAAALLIFAASSYLAAKWNVPVAVIRAAALAVPFVALCQTIVAASRGLKIMSHTLYAYWIGQSVSWIVFALIAWQVSKTAGATVYAYGASWLFGTIVAALLWRRATAKFEHLPADPGETRALLRFGAPRAPAALFSQALFWVDYFVLGIYVQGAERGVYAASVRLAQTLVLFLSAVSYMFSPFVADLYEKGEIKRLDGLFKAITRWSFAATLPLLALLLVEPSAALRIFGASFETGTAALRILLIGQIVNVSVGAAGFVLIMVRRTGWDLTVYASSFVFDVAMSFLLIPHLGTNGAAIAQTTTIAFSNAFRIYLVWRFVKIHPYNRYYFKLAIPFAVSLGVMIGAHAVLGGNKWFLDLILTGVIGTIAYAMVFALACLTPTEKAAVRRLRGSDAVA